MLLGVQICTSVSEKLIQWLKFQSLSNESSSGKLEMPLCSLKAFGVLPTYPLHEKPPCRPGSRGKIRWENVVLRWLTSGFVEKPFQLLTLPILYSLQRVNPTFFQSSSTHGFPHVPLGKGKSPKNVNINQCCTSITHWQADCRLRDFWCG